MRYNQGYDYENSHPVIFSEDDKPEKLSKVVELNDEPETHLYLLTSDIFHFAALVRAESPKKARKMMYDKYGSAWLNPDMTTCRKVKEQGKPSILIPGAGK